MIGPADPPRVVDLASRWSMDAALFLTLSALLLVWSLALAPASAVAFLITVGVGLLVDRAAPSLTDPAKIAEQSLEQPVGAYHESTARYVVTAVLAAAVFVAVALAFALALGSSSEGVAPLAGVSAAIGISRVLGVRKLRRLERERHIRLSADVGRWWRRSRTYYARPDLGIAGR
jgi:hypothetical protein